jgi:hypothetical protein
VIATIKGRCINCSGVVLPNDEIHDIPKGVSAKSVLMHMSCPETEPAVPAWLLTEWRRDQPLDESPDHWYYAEEERISPMQYFQGDHQYL